MIARRDPYSFFEHSNAIDQSLNSSLVRLNIFHEVVMLTGRVTVARRVITNTVWIAISARSGFVVDEHFTHRSSLQS